MRRNQWADVIWGVSNLVTGAALATVALRRKRTMFTLPIASVAMTTLFNSAEGWSRVAGSGARPTSAFRFAAVTASAITAASIAALTQRMLRFPSVATDVLTQLSTRLVFMEHLEKRLRAKRSAANVPRCAVLFVDLDRFKEVNDSFGHASGDRLLTDVAHRLRALVPKPNVIARLGGDEFGIVLETNTSAEAVEETATLIARSIAKPFAIDESHVVQVEASLGFAIDDGISTASQLLRMADESMYVRKRGKARETDRAVT